MNDATAPRWGWFQMHLGRVLHRVNLDPAALRPRDAALCGASPKDSRLGYWYNHPHEAESGRQHCVGCQILYERGEGRDG